MSRSARLESNTSSTRQAAAQRTRYRDEPDLQQRDSFALDEERTQLTIGGRRVPQDPDDWFDKPWKDFSYREIAYLLLRNAMFFPDYLYPSPNRKPVTPQRRRRLLFSYAPDWIITIGLWIALYFIDKVDGFRREFSITDTSLQHTYAVNERIPVYALGLMCLFPVIVYAAIGLGIMRSVWDFHSAVLGEVLSLALTISVTTIVKVLVGRPRPDILDRCQPVEGAANAIPYGLVTSAICTTDNLKRLKEGFRSFPSGHASTAWAGLGFFGFYIAGKLHLFDQRGHTIKAWIALVPFSAAGLVALSRVMDYRHHPTDIIAGSLLGLAFAWFSYRLYYPPLTHEMAHKPYSPRIPEAEETQAIDDRYSPALEGPEGTLKRPSDGTGQGAIGSIALRDASTRSRDSYGDLESGR